MVFPLVCHSDADQELWETDPYEYVRTKYGLFLGWIGHHCIIADADVYEEFTSTETAAIYFLHQLAEKRVWEAGLRIVSLISTRARIAWTSS